MAAEVVLWGEGADAGAWRVHAAPGAHAALAAEPGGGLRFDFALAGHGAFAIARRELAFTVPEHYVVTLRLRGDATPAELQLKLVDPSGANVWWWRRPGFAPARAGARIVLRQAALAFAWGPASGADPHRIGAVELAVASDAGARGHVVLEALRLEPRAWTDAAPVARASSAAPGHEAAGALARGPGWRPAPGDARPWLELDLGGGRELGGLALDFGAAPGAPACRLLGSGDGAQWTPVAEVPAGSEARRWLETGAIEARFLRLELDGVSPAPLRVALVSIERAVSPVRFAMARARAAPRGRHPRHLLGEHADWAVVGGDGDAKKGLLGADGALEIDFEGVTLEPFLAVDGRILGWADVEAGASLADGCLPIPSVTWRGAPLRLEVTAFASGAPGESTLVARYRVTNAGEAPRDARLLLAIRPFQVTPAWQALGLAPAVAPIFRLERAGGRVRVDDRREITPVTAPDAFAAAASEDGLDALLAGTAPAAERVHDPVGFAEACLRFDLRLAAGASEDVVVAVPWFAGTPRPPAGLPRAEAARWAEVRLAEACERWRARLARLPLTLPPAAAAFDESLRASLAWILVNREGPRLQPGPRCYRRSWIRDGALSGAALAELGFGDALADFLRWYAPHQHADGRVPCAVGRAGVDPAVEHDSHGQLVWAIVEAWRLSGDRDALRALWPHARRAVEALAALRAERCGDRFRGDPRFGLLPESISHEGYASRPVHSYWDDFFALRALADAADAAAALGDGAAHERIAALRDAMRRDVHASLAAVMARHGLDHLPGSVELGDFDPTSSAIALDPCGEDERLPPAALAATFERFWQERAARRRGERTPDAVTPYEIRNAVPLLRLGQKARALALLEGWIAAQRPPGWRQWPEVSAREPRAPRFIGDLPHGWVASGFLRAVRRLVVDERIDPAVLVIGAGVPEAWLRSGEGVRARGLPTRFGPLDLWLRADGDDCVRVRCGGPCRPPGGVVLVSPLARPLREVVVDGSARAAADPARLALPALPAEVELRY